MLVSFTRKQDPIDVGADCAQGTGELVHNILNEARTIPVVLQVADTMEGQVVNFVET